MTFIPRLNGLCICVIILINKSYPIMERIIKVIFCVYKQMNIKPWRVRVVGFWEWENHDQPSHIQHHYHGHTEAQSLINNVTFRHSVSIVDTPPLIWTEKLLQSVSKRNSKYVFRKFCNRQFFILRAVSVCPSISFYKYYDFPVF